MTKHNVVLSTNTGIQSTSEECKGDEEDNLHIMTDLDDDVALPMNPAFLTYPLLNPLYAWNPTFPQPSSQTHDLRPPRLTDIQFDQLLRSCSSPLPNIPIHDTTIPRTDFSQLLQPAELPANVVNALFRLGLQAHPDVVFFPAEITHEFSTGTLHRYQRQRYQRNCPH